MRPQTVHGLSLGSLTYERRTNLLYLRGWLPGSSDRMDSMTTIWKEDGRVTGAIITAAVLGLSATRPVGSMSVLVSQCDFLQLQSLPIWLCSCGTPQLQSQEEGRGRKVRVQSPQRASPPTPHYSDRKGVNRAKGSPTVTSSKPVTGLAQNVSAHLSPV